MSRYTLDELIDRWNRGQFAEVQVITHMLQTLLRSPPWSAAWRRPRATEPSQ